MVAAAWNPRYVAYAASHGRSPEAQLDADKAAWPADCMAPFMIWIGEHLQAFRAEQPAAFLFGGTLADHASFTAYLHRRVREGRGEVSWS